MFCLYKMKMGARNMSAIMCEFAYVCLGPGPKEAVPKNPKMEKGPLGPSLSSDADSWRFGRIDDLVITSDQQGP